jgi:hypothetical protein
MLSHRPTLRNDPCCVAQRRRRWPPRGPLTILFIISARRVFGRNSVSLSPLCCAPNSSLKAPVGDAVAVDPAISSGLPLPTMNRQPPPGSRPEKYSTPATKGFVLEFLPCDGVRLITSTSAPTASDPAENPYWKRDVRRAYPQLSVVTQSELSTLLVQHSRTPESVGLRFALFCLLTDRHLNIAARPRNAESPPRQVLRMHPYLPRLRSNSACPTR